MIKTSVQATANEGPYDAYSQFRSPLHAESSLTIAKTNTHTPNHSHYHLLTDALFRMKLITVSFFFQFLFFRSFFILYIASGFIIQL